MAVVQAVLLFGSKTWVLTPRLDKSLEGFHHRVARQMAGMVTKRQRDGTWVYTPIGAALEMVQMDEIGLYITCLQNTVEHTLIPVLSWTCVLRRSGIRDYTHPCDGGIIPFWIS